MNTITWMSSYLTFYLKGIAEFAQDHVKITIPNTILGLIPLGSQSKTLDVKHIASVDSNFSVSFGRLIIGALLASLLPGGLAVLFSGSPTAPYGIVYIFLGLMGISMALNAFQTNVTIATTSGERVVISFIIFEKSKASEMEHYISQIIAERTYDTNVRIHTDRSIAEEQNQTDRIIEAINGIKN